MSYKIKLKQGDACYVGDLTREDKQRVWDRFVADGAGRVYHYAINDYEYFEWYFDNLCPTNSTESNATVYTYAQIMEEGKGMSKFDIKEFKISDLKTGQRVTLENGRKYTIMTNVDHTSYKNDTVTIHYNEEGFGQGWDDINHLGSEIVKVESPHNIQSALQVLFGGRKDLTVVYTTIWEAPAKETPEQIRQRELREKYETTKKQLEELGKQIGVVE